MDCSCKTVTTGILLMMFGIALGVLVGVFWLPFLNLSGWILMLATVIAVVVVFICGIVGIISGCQQGQCINLSYLVLSVMTGVIHNFLLLAFSAILVTSCKTTGLDKCYSSSISFDQRNRNIVILCTIILTFLIMVVSFIGSCISCRARCYCCGVVSKGGENEVNERGAVEITSVV